MSLTDNDLQADSETAAGGQPSDWTNGFAQLPPAFYTRLRPTPLPEPVLRAWSPEVAASLGWDAAWFASDEAAHVLGGNALRPGMDPIATVYSGHQFGQWAGQLGDGRAIMLGETATGQEIQLKGSGKTPYSRMGDGRAVLRSSIREYLCSEAMHALGVPTTRALSLVASPQPVYRETVETAAVVARVAPSFVRFGHFEHFAARDQIDALRTLADYVIERYYPALQAQPGTAQERYAGLLREVSLRTAGLLAHWQAIGFCHGVMNTDNMSMLGLTLDYGPFQFLDHFDANHICNHSDTSGRYAFARQPQIAYWNLFCLGQALLPLIEDEKATVAAIDVYKDRLQQAFAQRMAPKLGLDLAGAEALIGPLLSLLQTHTVDYTLFWRRLSHAVADGGYDPVAELFGGSSSWQDWMLQYQERIALMDTAQMADLMLKTNPKYILRNYLGQSVIEAAQQGDWQPLHDLQAVLQSPYEEHPAFEDWAQPPPDWARHIEISCSS
ncbi:YdiU family protein [Comamonas humi]